MSNSGFPKVGVEFVAQNADEYAKALQNSVKAQADLTKEIAALSARLNESSVSLAKQRKYISDMTRGFTEVNVATTIFKQLMASGASQQEFANASEAVAAAQDRLQKSINSANAALGQQEARAKATETAITKMGQHFTSLSSAIGASRVGVGLFVRELVGVVGGTNVATQAVESFVYATGTMGIALAAATAFLTFLIGKFKEYQETQKAIKYYHDAESESLGRLSFELEKNLNLRREAAAFQSNLQVIPSNIQNSQSFGGIGATTPSGVNTLTSSIDALTMAQTQNAEAARRSATEYAKLSAQYDIADRLAQGLSRTYDQQKISLYDAADSYDVFIQKLAKLEGIDLEKLFKDAASGNKELADSALSALANLDAEAGRIKNIALGFSAAGVAQSPDFQAANAARASDLAERLGRQILDINRQANTQMQQLTRDHQARLTQITEDGVARRADIERNYAQRIADINDDLGENIADAEANAAQERQDRAQDYADRINATSEQINDKRLKIEQAYQDKLKDIQEQYTLSLFDAVARRDAKALIQAGQQREKQIKDAQRTRQRALDDAQKQKERDDKTASDNYAKQMRDLEQALARQEARLRLAAQRAIDTAVATRARELADQAEAEVKARDSENAGYKTRQSDLNAALAERKQSLIDALTQEQDITEKYARAIVESLRGILAPDEIARLLNDVQESLNAEISITIKPFVASGSGGGGVNSRAYANGGVVPYTQRALVHAGESVLPVNNPMRAYNLAMQHMGRMNIPMGGRGGGGSAGASGKVQVEVMLNGDMLSARIASQTDGVIATLLTGARARVGR